MAEQKALIVFLSILVSVQAQILRYNEPIKQTGVDVCKLTTGMYFVPSNLTCMPCPNGTIVRSDVLGCTCSANSRIVKDFGAGNVECAPCPDRMVASTTGYNCVRCPNDSYNVNSKSCSPCTGNQVILTEQDLLGNWYTSGTVLEQRCQDCNAETQASADKSRCVKCTNVLPVSENNSCNCHTSHGGFCFPSVEETKITPTTYTIPGTNVESAFFKDSLLAAHTMCKIYDNSTACQVLGNICVLTLYDFNTASVVNSFSFACDSYFDVLSSASKIWPPGKPWLYYVESDKRAMKGSDIVVDTMITTQYTFDPASYLQYRVARYNLKGQYIGTSDMFSRRFQLCVDTNKRSNAAFRFGTYYKQTVSSFS
ncbi:hypothetical protein CHS0354_035054 [Potamilus streckersoni]|uniref:Tyrosine-protein kinase ephrin type A/B receptor-like domain-containing protein n=1 Tax=Potamilus streckersoni TaxID=2493646 RepID=A0AAE0S7F2_9BIVA|nr:hypothetical protein CHS0354_035054 [Potamilus streckersoni]